MFNTFHIRTLVFLRITLEYSSEHFIAAEQKIYINVSIIGYMKAPWNASTQPNWETLYITDRTICKNKLLKPGI